MITLALAAVPFLVLAAPPSLLATTAPSPTMDSNMFPSLTTASHGPAQFPAQFPPMYQALPHPPTTTALATFLQACLPRCSLPTIRAHRASAPLAMATRTLSRWNTRMLTLTVRFSNSCSSKLSYPVISEQKTNHIQCLDAGYRLSNPSLQPVSPHTYMAQHQQPAWNMYPVYYPQTQSSVH